MIKYRNKLRAQSHHVLLIYKKLIINEDDFHLKQLSAMEMKFELERGKEEAPREKTGGTFSERSPDETYKKSYAK